LADSLDVLMDRILRDARETDQHGMWSASQVAYGAVFKAQSELRIAALSLGVQEDHG
jgi:hypothetical protein